MINKLKQMIAEPASKEWFAKHGSPKISLENSIAKGKANALKSASGKHVLKKARHLTPAERHAKMKTMGMLESSSHKLVDEKDYQRRIGRAYND